MPRHGGALNQRLNAYAAAGGDISRYGEAVDRLVARVHENGGGEKRHGRGSDAALHPSDVTGRLVDLKSCWKRGSRRDVLSVMCPYCRLNVRAVIQLSTGSKRWAVSRPRLCRGAAIARSSNPFRGAIPF